MIGYGLFFTLIAAAAAHSLPTATTPKLAARVADKVATAPTSTFTPTVWFTPYNLPDCNPAGFNNTGIGEETSAITPNICYYFRRNSIYSYSDYTNFDQEGQGCVLTLYSIPNCTGNSTELVLSQGTGGHIGESTGCLNVPGPVAGSNTFMLTCAS